MKLRVALKSAEKPKAYSISRFEELFGITYLEELTFSDWKTEQWLRKKCTHAYKRGKIEQLAVWLGTYHQKELERPEIPPVAIRWIHEKIGYGLFATQVFKQWGYIGKYCGVLRRRSLFNPNVNDYCFMYPREWITLRAYTIDSEKQGNYTRFINHSDYPNCESLSVFHNGVFHILFRTIKEIQPGEELTYNYGEVYWRNRKKLKN